MSEENRELVGRLLLHLRDGLAPIVEQVLAPHTPPGRSWTFLLKERERTNGRTARYAANDLQSMLVAMTGRIGALGYPFTPLLTTRSISALPSELRAVRNDFAHLADSGDDDTDSALDNGARLLKALESPQAEPVEAMLDAFRRQSYATAASAPVAVEAEELPDVRITLPVAGRVTDSPPAAAVDRIRASTAFSPPPVSPTTPPPAAPSDSAAAQVVTIRDAAGRPQRQAVRGGARSGLQTLRRAIRGARGRRDIAETAHARRNRRPPARRPVASFEKPATLTWDSERDEAPCEVAECGPAPLDGGGGGGLLPSSRRACFARRTGRPLHRWARSAECGPGRPTSA